MAWIKLDTGRLINTDHIVYVEPPKGDYGNGAYAVRATFAHEPPYDEEESWMPTGDLVYAGKRDYAWAFYNWLQGILQVQAFEGDGS